MYLGPPWDTQSKRIWCPLPSPQPAVAKIAPNGSLQAAAPKQGVSHSLAFIDAQAFQLALPVVFKYLGGRCLLTSLSYLRHCLDGGGEDSRE